MRKRKPDLVFRRHWWESFWRFNTRMNRWKRDNFWSYAESSKRWMKVWLTDV